MKKRVVKQFEYDGLGFPIILLNVPLVEIRGTEVPDINYNLLQHDLLLALCHKPSPLTGNEVRFIRQYLQMTYNQFAEKWGVTHPAVMNWEKFKDSPAKIIPTTEAYIRLCILDILNTKDKVFRQEFRELSGLPFKLKKQGIKHKHIKLNCELLSNS